MHHEYVYAIRDLDTGKLRSDLSYKSRTFWSDPRYPNEVIRNANNRSWSKGNYKVVAFKLQEVDSDGTV